MKIKRYKPCIYIGTSALGFVIICIYVTMGYKSISFRDEIYNIYWTLGVNKDYTNNYFEVSSCRASFAYQLIDKDYTNSNNIKLVDLNPKRHSCYIQLSDEQIINQCMSKTIINYQLISDRSLLPTPHPNQPLEGNERDKMLQEKYNQRVIEKGGCLLPKGMWGNPFNSRCTIVTMASIGNYKPNDLILDWGSGCGHQATWMTRLKLISYIDITSQT